ncbi:hypothetical protein [Nonomuraea angiospora]|uniref:hypothetical protein n=1 Tax=Nonomuraea angiospora TaxID=46172 RepID=UPI0029AF63A7|nr:hypothetical protein [Nonomuraea angiospora]MDX3099833.1 hypothetical protein [Nonomuraea angiospora]
MGHDSRKGRIGIPHTCSIEPPTEEVAAMRRERVITCWELKSDVYIVNIEKTPAGDVFFVLSYPPREIQLRYAVKLDGALNVYSVRESLDWTPEKGDGFAWSIQGIDRL